MTWLTRLVRRFRRERAVDALERRGKAIEETSDAHRERGAAAASLWWSDVRQADRRVIASQRPRRNVPHA